MMNTVKKIEYIQPFTSLGMTGGLLYSTQVIIEHITTTQMMNAGFTSFSINLFQRNTRQDSE